MRREGGGGTIDYSKNHGSQKQIKKENNKSKYDEKVQVKPPSVILIE